MMMCWTTWNIKTVAPNAPPCLAPSGIETFDYWIHDIPDYIENIENSLNGWWHLSNFCVSHRSASDMPCFAGDEGGTGSCYKSANYIETPRVSVTRLFFRSPPIRWGQILSSEEERVCEWGARMPHPARSGIWIWIQQIPSVNFEENVISNGHFESILFNEGVSISWLFYLEQNHFSVENPEILNNEKLGKDSCWMPVVRRPLCAHPQTAWFPSKANLNFGKNIRISF